MSDVTGETDTEDGQEEDKEKEEREEVASIPRCSFSITQANRRSKSKGLQGCSSPKQVRQTHARLGSGSSRGFKLKGVSVSYICGFPS